MDPTTVFPFQLDSFQTEACAAINRGDNVLVCAKTGSGKTLVAEFQIHVSLSKRHRIFYTTPIKSLSNQKYHDLKKQFPQATVGILTGDIKFCPDADIVVMTTEILRNLLYKQGTATEHIGLSANLSIDRLDAVIFDECHYMNDPDRGHVWEECFILLPPNIQMILLSATLSGPENLAAWLTDIKSPQRRCQLIQTTYRVVPLQHALLFPDNSLQILCNSKGEFNAGVYTAWLRSQKDAINQRNIAKTITQGENAKINHTERGSSFTHRMNYTLGILKERNLLPALFFVLNRRGCENYASGVTHNFIDNSDSAAVKHIMNYHLSRHMTILEKLPQYNKLYDLLSRGIGFHHSGLIPVLKEIVELLFSRGYIKVLFCTETFAVGLNMPTKTTLFTGFQKYDDSLERMRILRSDEYLQMAGRAGRRGKDTEGWAIYLPEKEPVEISDLKRMMTGSCQAIQSRIELSCDLILKTLLTSPSQATDILNKSYWARLRLEHRNQNLLKIGRLAGEICNLGITPDIEIQLMDRAKLEEAFRTATPQTQTKKRAQVALEQWKNRRPGKSWDIAWKNWGIQHKIYEEISVIEKENEVLLNFSQILQDRLSFLTSQGYVEYDDKLGEPCLTSLGLAASEINEASYMILPKFYSNLTESERTLLIQQPNMLIVLLSVFLESYWKPDGIIPCPRTVCQQSDIPNEIKLWFNKMAEIADTVRDYDGVSPRSLALSGDWMELLWRWLELGENPSVLCDNFELFEGNFARGVMKLGNILEEWIALATLAGHVEMIEACSVLRPQLARDFVLNDSLYLRLD
jgi:superfamily II RNA helicase